MYACMYVCFWACSLFLVPTVAGGPRQRPTHAHLHIHTVQSTPDTHNPRPHRYKIDPAIFDAWMRILQRVPGSVLWLLRFPPAGEANIRAEARRRGLEERLHFTDVAPKVCWEFCWSKLWSIGVSVRVYVCVCVCVVVLLSCSLSRVWEYVYGRNAHP
jgi:hypothetical protein